MANESNDWILINGKIITVDPYDTIVEAVAIKNGKIKQTGTTEQIQKLAGSQTSELDLDGKTVTPGIVDSHNHTVAYGLSILKNELIYSRFTSIIDIQNQINEKKKEIPPGF